MPVWLRNFTFRKINEHYEKEKEASEGGKTMDNQQVRGPNIPSNSDYSTKARN